jgi:hypothetical protein
VKFVRKQELDNLVLVYTGGKFPSAQEAAQKWFNLLKNHRLNRLENAQPKKAITLPNKFATFGVESDSRIASPPPVPGADNSRTPNSTKVLKDKTKPSGSLRERSGSPHTPRPSRAKSDSGAASSGTSRGGAALAEVTTPTQAFSSASQGGVQTEASPSRFDGPLASPLPGNDTTPASNPVIRDATPQTPHPPVQVPQEENTMDLDPNDYTTNRSKKFAGTINERRNSPLLVHIPDRIDDVIDFEVVVANSINFPVHPLRLKLIELGDGNVTPIDITLRREYLMFRAVRLLSFTLIMTIPGSLP